jgi:predicted alpha/beta-fold hydrolase
MLTKSKFQPAWWLRNAHLQTLWAAKVHPAPLPAVSRERLTTPDGDFVDLDCTEITDGPVAVIFHGLTGSFKSRYVRSIMSVLHARGFNTVLMHFRGCSGEPNRTRGSYHSGHTVDIEFVINTIAKRFSDKKIVAIGYSLGGNALLKYLATCESVPLHFAVSVCPPLVLKEGATRINTGFSRVYQNTLIKQMRAALRHKQARYPELGIDQYNYESVSDFITWDDQITAPLHGYASGDDYYRQASTLADLKTIGTKTHIVFSTDDPFFTQRCIPQSNEALSKQVTFELVAGAGHVGFISGAIPGIGTDWLRHRVAELVEHAVAHPAS